MRLILVIVTLLAFAAHAEDECSEIHLDRDGGPMSQLPIYDQRDAVYASADEEICFAVSGSYLIDAHRASASAAPLTQFSSPASLALNVNAEFASQPSRHQKTTRPRNPVTHNLLADGDIGSVLDVNQKAAICDQTWLNNFTGNPQKGVMPTGAVIGKLHRLPSLENFLAETMRSIYSYKVNEVIGDRVRIA